MIKMWSEDEGNDFRCVETLFSSSAVQRCLPHGDAKVILGTERNTSLSICAWVVSWWPIWHSFGLDKFDSPKPCSKCIKSPTRRLFWLIDKVIFIRLSLTSYIIDVCGLRGVDNLYAFTRVWGIFSPPFPSSRLKLQPNSQNSSQFWQILQSMTSPANF